MQAPQVSTQPNWLELYEQLARPFSVESLYWRAGAVSRDKKRAQALPYAEPRVYEDRLNDLCPGAWEVTFKPWGENRIICELSIHGVTRSSTGEENDGFAPGTAAEAQAFKRACVKFGLGRYLYDIPISWVPYDAERRQLSETPKLLAKFLPAIPKTSRAKPSSVQQDVPTPPLLTPERAVAMGRELIRLGYASASQLELAGEVLGHDVAALESLSEAEALEVWTYAKRSSERAA